MIFGEILPKKTAQCDPRAAKKPMVPGCSYNGGIGQILIDPSETQNNPEQLDKKTTQGKWLKPWVVWSDAIDLDIGLIFYGIKVTD